MRILFAAFIAALMLCPTFVRAETTDADKAKLRAEIAALREELNNPQQAADPAKTKQGLSAVLEELERVENRNPQLRPLAPGIGAPRAPGADKPELTEAEKKDGWVLLFDGTTTTGWKKVGGKAFPDKGWAVENGTLHHSPMGGGGDIITVDAYENFEFAWEWKLASGANGGMKYRVADAGGAAYGPEYQMLDDAKQADGKNPKTSTGSLYQIYAPNDKRKVNVGDWNSSKVVVNGNHCEHWLNGEKIVEYEFFSDDWKAGVSKSKFKDNPKYAQPAKGHICFQDHGDEVWLRNIKIKVINK